jgi:MoaA/NifB/PqqE/SkfB family radical SAM enzyme
MRILSLNKYLPTIKGLIKNRFAKEAVFPFYASFKVTAKCHFGCPFCNMRKDDTQDRSTSDIKAVLDNLSRSPVLMTSFEGGEPLLRKDIGDLLQHARNLNFYILFTTSVRNILEYPIKEYARLIDFLHISIDEGHGNLEMFRLLPSICELPVQVSVQTVVTADTVNAIDDKVRLCHEAGANIVVIPAAPMDGAKNCFPDIAALGRKMAMLRQKYPKTIHTPQMYFNSYSRHRCSSASIIIAPDCRIYYPCHILGKKGPDLTKTDLTEWLESPEAAEMRKTMRDCKKNCGWYQYYSIESYLSMQSAWESLAPAFFQKKRKKSV